MIKETIICIVIISIIVGLDIYTQNFTEQAISEMTSKLTNLRERISKEDTEQIKNEINEIEEIWNGKHDKLAYYIEHDELEKVNSGIIKTKSYIETKDYSKALAELAESKFVLEHIQEKNSFNFQNIF